MARDYAKLIAGHKHHIQYLKEKIAQIESTLEGGVSHISDMPKGSPQRDKFADLIQELENTAFLLVLAEIALKDRVNEIEEQIASVKDPVVQALMRELQINGRTWGEAQVAIAKIDPAFNYSLRHLKRLYANALRN